MSRVSRMMNSVAKQQEVFIVMASGLAAAVPLTIIQFPLNLAKTAFTAVILFGTYFVAKKLTFKFLPEIKANKPSKWEWSFCASYLLSLLIGTYAVLLQKFPERILCIAIGGIIGWALIYIYLTNKPRNK